MSRIYPRLQLPQLPKSMESGDAAHKHYHGAFVPPPAASTEDVPDSNVIAKLCYEGSPYVTELVRDSNSICSQTFILQCKQLFNKMQSIKELSALFDQEKYAYGGLASENTSYAGQFMVSLRNVGGGLYPNAPEAQLLLIKKTLEHIYYFYHFQNKFSAAKVRMITALLEKALTCGPGAYENLLDVQKEIFSSKEVTLDAWLAKLRETTIEHIAAAQCTALDIKVGMQRHMRPALKLKARTGWGLNLGGADEEFDDRHIRDLNLTENDYDTALSDFTEKYATDAVQYVVNELRHALLTAFNQQKPSGNPAAISHDKYNQFNEALKELPTDFGVSGNYFLNLNDDETAASLNLSDELLTNVVLAAFVSRDILDTKSYIALGNNRYLFQHHDKVFLFDKNQSSAASTVEMAQLTMQQVLLLFSSADIQAMQDSELSWVKECYQQLPKPSEITKDELTAANYSPEILIRLHNYIKTPELKDVIYQGLRSYIQLPDSDEDEFEKILKFYQRENVSFLLAVLTAATKEEEAIKKPVIKLYHVIPLFSTCKTSDEISQLFTVYPKLNDILNDKKNGHNALLVQAMLDKIALIMQCKEPSIKDFLANNLRAQNAVIAELIRVHDDPATGTASKSEIYGNFLQKIRSANVNENICERIILFFHQADKRHFELALVNPGINESTLKSLLNACQTPAQVERLMKHTLFAADMLKTLITSKVGLLIQLRSQKEINSLLQENDVALRYEIEHLKTPNDLEWILTHQLINDNQYHAAILKKIFEITPTENSIACLNMFYAKFPNVSLEEFVSDYPEKILRSNYMERNFELIFNKNKSSCVSMLHAINSAHPNFSQAQKFLKSKPVFDFMFESAETFKDYIPLLASNFFEEEHAVLSLKKHPNDEELLKIIHFFDGEKERNITILFLYAVNNKSLCFNRQIFPSDVEDKVLNHPLIKLLRKAILCDDDKKKIEELLTPIDSDQKSVVTYVATHTDIPSFVAMHEYNKCVDATKNPKISFNELSALYKQYSKNPKAARVIVQHSRRKLAFNDNENDNLIREHRNISAALLGAIIKDKMWRDTSGRYMLNVLDNILYTRADLTPSLIMTILESMQYDYNNMQDANELKKVLNAVVQNTKISFDTYLKLAKNSIKSSNSTRNALTSPHVVKHNVLHLYLIYRKYLEDSATPDYNNLTLAEKKELISALLPHANNPALTFLAGVKNLLNNYYKEKVFETRTQPDSFADLAVVKEILDEKTPHLCTADFLCWVIPYVAHDQATLKMIAEHENSKNDLVITALAKLPSVSIPQPVVYNSENVLPPPSHHRPPDLFLFTNPPTKLSALKTVLTSPKGIKEFESVQVLQLARVKSYLISQIQEYIKRRTDPRSSEKKSTAVHARPYFFGAGNEGITQKKVAEAYRLCEDIIGAKDIDECKNALTDAIEKNKKIVSWTHYRQGDFKLVLDHCVKQCDELSKPESGFTPRR